jgi:uncharacterized protein (DUF488 family)
MMNTVYTIGYEGTDIERFVQTLKAVGVEVLADVRAVALSRKKGFSKTALRNMLADAGIEYVHFNALGDPKSGREAARAGKYEEFRKIYGQHLATTDAQVALKELETAVKLKTTCLLCFERDPNVCHRSIVTQALRSDGNEIFDLYGDSPARYDNFSLQLARYHAREGAAAA